MATGRRLSIFQQDLFTRIACWTTRVTGGRWGFLTAAAAVFVWAVMGPYFNYSQNWQLVINTGTTIVTFLMVFLIQNAQNRESKAIHLKLDELILAVRKARNELIDVERLTEDQLDRLSEEYHKVAESDQQRLIECLDKSRTADEAPKGSANGTTPHMTVK